MITNSVVGTLAVPQTNPMKRASEDVDLGRGNKSPQRVGERSVAVDTFIRDSHLITSVYSHVWLFEGAEGGKWLQQLYRELGISLLVPLEGDTRSPPKSDTGDGRKESKKQRIV
jgi:hypothetical protein